jgi:L-lactate dehydrogenase (cytochrome)
MTPTYFAKRRMRKVFCLDDFEQAARRHLPASIFAYVCSPAEVGQSMDDNRAVFQDIRFVPRILRDVSKRTTAQTLRGANGRSRSGSAPWS